jgi:2-polyprenyl-3-methyl-5-hydroxy-6-metoxy-1,4-benzoquinol methylase
MRTALYHRSAHLPEAKLTPPLAGCVICGTRFDNPPIAKIQQSPDVFLRRCPNCHACTASRMPTPEALNEYYANYFHPSVPKITHDSPERFARHIASFIREPRRDMAITDFGGGDGGMAYSLAQILANRGCSSIEINVVDYVECIASRDPRIIIQAQRPGAPIPPSDIIIASAVLEHLTDPLESLTQLLGALGRDGLLYFRTPAVAGFLELATACGRQLDFTFPAHLHDFGQQFWENILSLIPDGEEFEILHSAPSLVETDFRHHPLHTIAAHIAKAPWRVLGRSYTLVGGWEIVFQRK